MCVDVCICMCCAAMRIGGGSWQFRQNIVLCGIYDCKKISVVRFSMSVVFIFATYITVDCV